MSVKDFVQQRRDDFIAMRRDFHMYPEPAWLEYRSAAKVAEKLIALGYDVALGAEVLDLDSRMGLPSEDVMKAAMARAMDEGADPELVEKMGYGILYSQFEVPDARRVYAVFDQPDIKAVFDFSVLAAKSWIVIEAACS